MTIIKHHDDVYEILDLIAVTDTDALSAMLDQINYYNLWAKEDPLKYTHGFYQEAFLEHLSEFDTNFNFSVMHRIVEDLGKIFNTEPDIEMFWQVFRFDHTNTLHVHVDNQTGDQIDSNFKFTALLYWNDNYEGGEINYPDLGVTIKPRQWSIIIHSADVAHEVFPIKPNCFRYSSPASIRFDQPLWIKSNLLTVGDSNETEHKTS
jgi:hypothetical protein